MAKTIPSFSNLTCKQCNVFGIVAYNNPNLDYISITKMPQPGYTDRLEDDTLSNKRYSAAWEKISLISILNFLRPSETFFIYVTATFMWLWHSCDSCVPVHPQYGKTSCVQPFDVADVMIPKYFRHFWLRISVFFDNEYISKFKKYLQLQNAPKLN